MGKNKKLDALTSLRFFAAALIVIGHSHALFGSCGLANAAPLGQGVSFFFVLSGFILSWNYPSLVGTKERINFWVARFARIWPLHAVTCLMWIAIGTNFKPSGFGWDITCLLKLISNLLLVQAWIPLHDWALSYNGVSWSISAEFFFYALFPILITLIKKSWHKVLFICGAYVLGLIIYCNFNNLPGNDDYPSVGLLGVIYLNPAVRLFEFVIGMILAELIRKIIDNRLICNITSCQWLSLEVGIILLSCIAMLAAANFIGISQTIGPAAAYYFTREGLWLLWALLIGVFALSRGPVAKILSCKLLIFLGEISFSLYLIHALVIKYFTENKNIFILLEKYTLAVFWFVCIFLSIILYISVEKPFRALIIGLKARRFGIIAGVKDSFKFIECACILALFTLSFTLCWFKISSINEITNLEINNIFQSKNLLFSKNYENVTVGEKYAIQRVVVSESSDDKISISIVLNSQSKIVANDVVGIHLNDEKGNVIANFDTILDKSEKYISSGVKWIHDLNFTKKSWDSCYSFSIVAYSTPKNLYTFSGGETDWGGKRLLISKDQSSSASVVEKSATLNSVTSSVDLGVFDETITIKSINPIARKESCDTVCVVFKSDKNIVNQKMDVHLNEASGNILSKSSRIVSESIISSDKNRILYFEFEKGSLMLANSVGICVYDNVLNLYTCKGNSLDWRGKRLVYIIK